MMTKKCKKSGPLGAGKQGQIYSLEVGRRPALSTSLKLSTPQEVCNCPVGRAWGGPKGNLRGQRGRRG